MINIRIIEIIWLNDIVEKIRNKHNVTVMEVEEVFKNKPNFRREPKGNYVEENIFFALGRTDGNRL